MSESNTFYAGSSYQDRMTAAFENRTLDLARERNDMEAAQPFAKSALSLQNTNPFNTPNTGFTTFALGSISEVHASNGIAASNPNVTRPQSYGLSALGNSAGTLASSQTIQTPSAVNQPVLEQRAREAEQASAASIG